MTTPDAPSATTPDSPSTNMLDLTDATFDPFGQDVANARAASWRAATPFGPAVLRYEDVTALLADNRFGQGSAALLELQGIHDGPLHDWWQRLILNLEGPAHDRLRRLVAPAFRPTAIGGHRRAMRDIASRLAECFTEPGNASDPFDAVAGFADPYPVAVLMALLGLDDDLRPQMGAWSTDLGLAFSFAVPQHREQIEKAVVGLHGHADDLIAARTEEPANDLVTALLAARDGDERLTNDELRALIVTLVFAGHDTTRNQLGLALELFANHPEQWSLLAERPELAPAAVEEVMRVAPAVPVIFRLALTDVTYRDLDIAAGTLVSLMVSSANTDPDYFGPGFDITASRARQLTFGGGTHHCLGSALARAELVEALTVLACRFQRLHVIGEPTYRPPTGIYGPTHLPMVATPRRSS